MKGDNHGVDSSGVVRCGYLKKLKTYRKKYFVLRAETPDSSARLEYYDSERKYNGGLPPKRSIPLKNCFNINRRKDTKHKHVIALYTKDDCFCVVLDHEEEADEWLKALLSLQHGEEAVDGEAPKPTFEHVWQVTVLERGLGTAGGITGSYRLCLTDKTLSLIKLDSEVPQIELNLTNIRSCGSLRDFFFLEIGRSSTLGAGELWMQTEDNNIAQNVQSTVFHAMSSKGNKEELGPKSRNRSSSATESSKPNTMGRKYPINAPPKCHILSQDNPHSTTDSQVPTTSSSSTSQHSLIAGDITPLRQMNHQRTQSLPLANNLTLSTSAISENITTPHLIRPTVKRSNNQSSKCMSGGGRERCDSMPSRARTTSEGGNHSIQMWNHQNKSHHCGYRPASIYKCDISHSPPQGSPVSPPSVGCSTDSAGSSYSLTDEGDNCHEMDTTVTSLGGGGGRYSHSLTPDEAIAEEDCLDSSPSLLYGVSPNYTPMALPSSDDGYVDMWPKRNDVKSPTASLSSVTSGTPSTDLRFSEYPLEKVSSYFARSDYEDPRPARAYSVGSRPVTASSMMNSSSDSLRARALSVGSKTKKCPGRVLPPPGYHHQSGAKSSSAPILNNSRGPGSHNSIGPMDDLMEMDFSRSGSINSTDYMEMTPGLRNNSGYVEMKPGVVRPRGTEDTSAYVDMTSGSSPARGTSLSESQHHPQHNITTNGHYMDMNATATNNNPDYTDMSFVVLKKSPVRASFLLGSSSSSTFDTSPHSNELRTPEGYVEMSVGKGHRRQSSLDGLSRESGNEDYANMSGKKRSVTLTDKKRSKTRSQPINIQNPTVKNNVSVAGSNSPIYALMSGRKYSTGTPPSNSMHLALNDTSPYSSLPRQRKNSRRDSKDSSSSSVTTPSSSSTIFPLSLNSPCSPSKPVEQPPQHHPVIKVPPSVLNTPYKKKPTKKNDNMDYTPMDFDCGKSAKNQVNSYVNYSPGVSSGAGVSADVSDYALMTSRLTLADTSTFRPINEHEQDVSGSNAGEVHYEVLRTTASRPSSVAESNRSRPSSTSSELCSSFGSTVVAANFRPDSVNSDRIRPGSVTTDVQLHYASLDLEEGSKSPRSVKNNAGEGTSVGQVEATLTYAAIDFVKSEGLNKQNSITQNVTNKIKQ